MSLNISSNNSWRVILKYHNNVITSPVGFDWKILYYVGIFEQYNIFLHHTFSPALVTVIYRNKAAIGFQSLGH